MKKHIRKVITVILVIATVIGFSGISVADEARVLKFGADGIWGAECEALAKRALCQKEKVGYKNTHLVKIIQNAVGVTADGKFGKDTKNAVIKYQKSNALESDGIVGYNTWKKILGVAK